MFKKILVASDVSEGGLNAVAAAADFALKCGAELVALHVYELAPLQALVLGGAEVNSLECIDPSLLDTWMAGMNLSTKRQIEAVLLTRSVAFKFRQEAGPTATTIVRVAKEEHCDLIVVGSRGLSGVQAFFLGSVSERVAHLAHCSVLIDRQH